MRTLRVIGIGLLFLGWLILAATSSYPDSRFPEPVNSHSYITRP